MGRTPSSLAYVCNFKKRGQLGKQFSVDQHLRSKESQVERLIQNGSCEQYQRLKTVFGHANMAEGSASAVYNCTFDMADKVIITGADDG